MTLTLLYASFLTHSLVNMPHVARTRLTDRSARAQRREYASQQQQRQGAQEAAAVNDWQMLLGLQVAEEHDRMEIEPIPSPPP